MVDVRFPDEELQRVQVIAGGPIEPQIAVDG